jgi:hypothetical protein
MDMDTSCEQPHLHRNADDQQSSCENLKYLQFCAEFEYQFNKPRHMRSGRHIRDPLEYEGRMIDRSLRFCAVRSTPTAGKC